MIFRSIRSGYQKACYSTSGLVCFGTCIVHMPARFDTCRSKPESKRLFTIPATMYDTQNQSGFPVSAPVMTQVSCKTRQNRPRTMDLASTALNYNTQYNDKKTFYVYGFYDIYEERGVMSMNSPESEFLAEMEDKEQYSGLWIAISGAKVVASGKNSGDVYAEAAKYTKGKAPLLVAIPDKDKEQTLIL